MTSSPDEAVLATRAAYESDAVAWANRNHRFDLRALRQRRLAEMTGGGGTVLDLGCGPGLDAPGLRELGLTVVGLDITHAMLAIAAPKLGGRALIGDSRRLPFAADAFEGVWASASLLHLPKDQVAMALAEVRRVLKPGGAFYSGMKGGDHDGFVEPWAGHPVKVRRHFSHYQPDEWTAYLAKTGFAVEEQAVENAGAVLPDTPWIITYARNPR